MQGDRGLRLHSVRGIHLASVCMQSRPQVLWKLRNVELATMAETWLPMVAPPMWVSILLLKLKVLGDANHQCETLSYWNWKGRDDASHQCESISYWTCNSLMMEATNAIHSLNKGLDDASHQCEPFSYWNWKGLDCASHQCESISYWTCNGLMTEATNVSHSLNRMERARWCKSPKWVILLLKWKGF